MTAGTSQPVTVSPAWNPNKPAAPNPPGAQGAGPSRSSGEPAENVAGTSRNIPDVTADIAGIYDPGSEAVEEEPRPASPVSVPPDYPLDSLPRGASAHSLMAQPTQTDRHVSQSRVRNNSSGTSNARHSDPTSRHSDPSSTVVPSVNPVGGEVSNISHRVPSNIPTSRTYQPHVQYRQGAQTSVTHSNVSVNVNPGGNRQIRTHDLNVGVVSRVDPNRPTGNVLPDLVTQSQPPPTARHSSSAQRSGHPTDPRTGHPTDQRVSQNYRTSAESHQRSRYRDRRHSRPRRHSHRHGSSSADEPCKEGCLKCLAVGFSFRWILVVLSLLGVSCVVTGIVLAALHAAGNSFLFLAIMFIGLGVLLVVVVGVGWKCTPRGHEPLHALFNLGDFRTRRGRRHRSRHHREGRWYGDFRYGNQTSRPPPSYNASMQDYQHQIAVTPPNQPPDTYHPFFRRQSACVMYPEFQFRRPPPSYNASMQDYQHQIAVTPPNQPPDTYDPGEVPDEDYSLPSSPPPSYRSRASTVRAGIQITFPPNQGGDYPDSRPPTYRSHPSNTLQGHGRTRPSLSRDEDNDDLDPDDRAPEDVAFTGSSVIVDTNSHPNTTSIQIDPNVVSNQNVTVSVTTVSVTTQAAPSSSHPVSASTQPNIIRSDVNVAVIDNQDFVDPVGDSESDHVMTQL